MVGIIRHKWTSTRHKLITLKASVENLVYKKTDRTAYVKLSFCNDRSQIMSMIIII